MRLRNSVSSASGTFTLKGRRAVLSLPVCFATAGVISSLLLIEFVGWSEGRNRSAEHQVREWTSALCARSSHTSLYLDCAGCVKVSLSPTSGLRVNRPQAKSASAGRIYGLSLHLLYTKPALRSAPGSPLLPLKRAMLVPA